MGNVQSIYRLQARPYRSKARCTSDDKPCPSLCAGHVVIENLRDKKKTLRNLFHKTLRIMALASHGTCGSIILRCAWAKTTSLRGEGSASSSYDCRVGQGFSVNYEMRQLEAGKLWKVDELRSKDCRIP